MVRKLQIGALCEALCRVDWRRCSVVDLLHGDVFVPEQLLHGEADRGIETTFVLDDRDRVITKKEKLTNTSVYAETVYFYGKRDQLTKVTNRPSEGGLR